MTEPLWPWALNPRESNTSETCTDCSKGQEHRFYDEQLWKLGWVRLEKRRLRGGLVSSAICKGIAAGTGLAVLVLTGHGLECRQGRFRLDIGKIFTERVVGTGTGAPGRRWSHHPGRVQNPSGCGALGHGLAERCWGYVRLGCGWIRSSGRSFPT